MRYLKLNTAVLYGVACALMAFATQSYSCQAEVTGALRNASGNLIGTVKQKSSGKLEIRDCHGRLAGTYDQGTNTTRDAKGRLYGKGYLLPALVIHCG